MLSSRPYSHENWRTPLPPAPTIAHSRMSSRPMLACANGSFLPLIVRYDAASLAQVFELDASLCRDVELVVRRAPATTPRYQSSLTRTPGEPVQGHVVRGGTHSPFESGRGEQGLQLDYQVRHHAG
jgi:hypothetical protein